MIAGNFHWYAGFSQTVAAYVAAAAAADCEIRGAGRLSRHDAEVARHLPVEDDLGWGTHLVVMFEAKQYLAPEQRELVEVFPRHRRVVIDFDGHWDADDTGVGDIGVGDSMAGRYSAQSWTELYSALTDVVLQPRISGSLPDGACYFPCFGLPACTHPRTLGSTPQCRDFDVQYIGSNWWRWGPLTEVVEAARRAQPALDRIRVCGQWWDGELCPGFEDATANEPGLLRAQGVHVEEPVPFGHVVAEMGRAVVSPVLVRPLVAGTGLLTPRMFETLASGSIPALPSGAEFIAAVYGGDAEQLMLGTDPAAVMTEMVADLPRYARVVGTIQDHVRAEYGYERLLATLLTFLQ